MNGVAILLRAGALLIVAASSSRAVAPASVPLPDSTRAVETAPATGALDPHKAFIVRSTLKAEEEAAPMRFEVALTMRNFADLQARVAKGERISPAEMAATYEPSAADYDRVVRWLTQHGFTIVRRDPHHMAVFAEGPVRKIESALQVHFARVALEGQEYTSAVSTPQIDASIAPLILGINGLQPQIRAHKHSMLRQTQPNASTGSGSYFPGQIATAYSASQLYGQGLTGAGQSIAIIIDTFPATSDLVSFWKGAGVSQSLNNIDFIQVVSGTLSAPSGEETLDTEWSSSIAPQAKVRIYATTDLADNDLDSAYEQVYTDVSNHPEYGLHQMSMSYGGGEDYTTKAQVTTDDQYFAELASAGVTIFASAGDGGSTPGSKSAGDESGPLQVENPASDPNVTGVGGTSLQLNASNQETSETVWNNSYGATGGGVSIYFSRPSWQTGTGVPSGSMRYVPDVSCPADPNYGAIVVLGGSELVYGGTSWASPTWAGFCALLNQARSSAGQSSLGALNPKIYPLLGTANVRDITSGNNATSKSNGKYSAGVGYDETTGVGSPLVTMLGETLVGNASIQGVSVQPAEQTTPPGQTATITATAGGSPTGYQWQAEPVGSSTYVSLSNNGYYTGATSATLTIAGVPSSLSGNLYRCVVSYGSAQVTSTASVLIVDTPLTTITVAGTAQQSGNVNGTGTAAEFAYPSGVAVDSSGNIYVADFSNNCIREISPAGSVTTPYGSTSGTSGSSDGAGNSALFNEPNDVVIDKSNNLYVADSGNNSVRKIVLATNMVSTLATGFNSPQSVAVDAAGNVYVSDTSNEVVQKIVNGSASVLAGKLGQAGYANGSGTNAEFNTPMGLAVDASSNVYVADFGNDVIRMITPGGVVTTLAGVPGQAGDLDGPAAQALFNAPLGLSFDPSGNLNVTDSLVPATNSTEAGNNLLRKITPTGVVSTIAGDAGVTGSSNGTGSAAQFYSLQGVRVSSSGEIFLADTYNQLVRAAGYPPSISAQPVAQVVTVGQPVTFSIGSTGSGSITYQWELNGSSISGATSPSYTIPSVAAGNAGDYSVVVSDPFGSVTSAAAALVPVTAQPTAETASPGQSVTFSTTPVGNGGPFTYQYLFNGSPISGATNASYTINPVTNASAGTYSVIVTDSYGSATSSSFTLTVSAAVASDSPTMPMWGLILVAVVLLGSAAVRFPQTGVSREEVVP